MRMLQLVAAELTLVVLHAHAPCACARNEATVELLFGFCQWWLS